MYALAGEDDGVEDFLFEKNALIYSYAAGERYENG